MGAPQDRDFPDGDRTKEWIRARSRDHGLDEVGFTTCDPLPRADFLAGWLAAGRHGTMGWLAQGDRHQPTRLLADARTLIVALARYAANPAEPAAIAAYAVRPDYHRVLRERLGRLGADLEERWPGSRTRAAVDTAPLLEREAAQRAGLGWIGKSTMLVHPRFGCYTLLGTLSWTEEVPPDTPALDQCGRCRQCLDACPTGALDAEYRMDARRCLSYLTIERREAIPEEFREALEGRAFGCDACLAACPFGSARVHEESPVLPTDEALRDRDPGELLEQAAAHFQRSFGWTPVERARKRGFLRNLLLAIAHRGDAALLPRVREFLDHEDGAVRDHAAWAVRRLEQGRD